jgi:hypothetical protein
MPSPESHRPENLHPVGVGKVPLPPIPEDSLLLCVYPPNGVSAPRGGDEGDLLHVQVPDVRVGCGEPAIDRAACHVDLDLCRNRGWKTFGIRCLWRLGHWWLCCRSDCANVGISPCAAPGAARAGASGSSGASAVARSHAGVAVCTGAAGTARLVPRHDIAGDGGDCRRDCTPDAPGRVGERKGPRDYRTLVWSGAGFCLRLRRRWRTPYTRATPTRPSSKERLLLCDQLPMNASSHADTFHA